jgi:predicted NAD/FAD-binding protein
MNSSIQEQKKTAALAYTRDTTSAHKQKIEPHELVPRPSWNRELNQKSQRE